MKSVCVSPADHQVVGPGRCIVASRGDELLVREFASPEQVLTFNLDTLPYAGDDLEFKLQVRIDGKWRLAARGRFDVPPREVERRPAVRAPLIAPQFLLGSDTIDERILADKLAECVGNSRAKLDVAVAVRRLMAKIWSDDHGSDERVAAFCSAAETASTEGQEIVFLDNVAFYLRQYLALASDFDRLGIRGFNYFDIVDYRAGSREFNVALDNRLRECDSRSELEASRLFSGMLKSFIGDRSNAGADFGAACEGSAEFINTFKLDLGAHTYGSKSSRADRPKVAFHQDDKDLKGRAVVIISMDENFLRRYGPYLFWISHVLVETRFHFHLISASDRQLQLVAMAQEFYSSLAKFFGGKIENAPSYSTSSVPVSVASPKTYYACGRYIVAGEVMDRTGGDVYIMDADLFLDGGMEDYLRSVSRFDVSLPVSRGLRALPPWRRFQAGNVYIKNSPGGRIFLSNVQDYMSAYFGVEKSWMLDQNALSFAVEMCRGSVSIGSYSMIKIKRPTFQLALAGNIERRK